MKQRDMMTKTITMKNALRSIIKTHNGRPKNAVCLKSFLLKLLLKDIMFRGR